MSPILNVVLNEESKKIKNKNVQISWRLFLSGQTEAEEKSLFQKRRYCLCMNIISNVHADSKMNHKSSFA